jgi:hypothetical protein
MSKQKDLIEPIEEITQVKYEELRAKLRHLSQQPEQDEVDVNTLLGAIRKGERNGCSLKKVNPG